jgi:hypothetical protein
MTTVASLHPKLRETTPPERFPTFAYRDAQVDRDTSYVVKGLLGSASLAVIWGAPKSGKSFVALDLALHIAAGRPWRGHRVRQGVVIYVAAEAGGSMRTRVAAAKAKFGHDDLPFVVVPAAVNLLAGEDFEELVATLRRIEAERGKIVAIFVDTLSRTAPGANENAPEDMTAYVGSLDRLRQTFTATIVVVHHSGKDREKGMRGHSALLAAVDTGIEVADRTITFAIQRDQPGGESFAFELEVVELGEDDEGDPIRSCIVAEREAPSPKSKHDTQPSPRGPNQRIAFDALVALLSEGGSIEKPPSVPDGVAAVRIETWRAEFDRRSVSDPRHRGSRFNEAVNGLSAAGLVHVRDGFAWCSRQGNR